MKKLVVVLMVLVVVVAFIGYDSVSSSAKENFGYNNVPEQNTMIYVVIDPKQPPINLEQSSKERITYYPVSVFFLVRAEGFLDSFVEVDENARTIVVNGKILYTDNSLSTGLAPEEKLVRWISPNSVEVLPGHKVLVKVITGLENVETLEIRF